MNSAAVTPARRAPLHGLFARTGSEGWIVGPWYDGLWFIFSPLWAVALGWLATRPPFTTEWTVFDATKSVAVLGYMAVTQSHLTITLARSHANAAVFKRHKLRFLLVPLLLLLALLTSKWVFAIAAVLGTWWDVYHSSLQTFGFGRIYDAKAGNDPEVGRRLDIIFNLLVYAGPVLAGSVLVNHLDTFKHFGNLEPLSLGFTDLDGVLFASVQPYVQSEVRLLRVTLIGFAILFTAFYLLSYRQYHRDGYRLPWQKGALLLSTAVCTVFAWGFNSFGMAFLIVNVFHALQYYALVWWTERRNLGRISRLGHEGARGRLLLVLFVAASLVMGLPLAFMAGHGVASVLLVCALMHFWYDSFIWSVRKKEHLEVAA